MVLWILTFIDKANLTHFLIYWFFNCCTEKNIRFKRNIVDPRKLFWRELDVLIQEFFVLKFTLLIERNKDQKYIFANFIWYYDFIY